jgi:hypothetical protein
MSSINSVGGTDNVYSVYTPPRVSAPVASNGGLDKLQAVMKQIESAANTRAIPAHQSW